MANILIALSSILCFFIAVIVFAKNSKSPKNLSLSVIALSTSIWAMAFVFYYMPNVFDSFFWIKIIYFCVIFQIASIFYFAFAFPDNKKPPVWSLILFGFLNSVIIFQLFFTQNFVVGVEMGPNGIETKLGPFYNFVVVTWASYLNFSVFLLVKKFRKATGVIKMQAWYVLLGIGTYMGATVFSDAIVPIFFGHTSFFIVSALSSLFFVALTAYAIIKHRLMDIRLVLARTITYSVLITLVGTLYAATTFAAGVLFLGPSTTSVNQLIIYTILTIIVALSFQSLRSAIEKITDKIFFKGVYDSNQLLSSLAVVMSTNIELRPLVTQILTTMTTQMRINGAVLILTDQNGIYDQVSVGFKSAILKISQITPLLQKKEIVIFDELEEGDLKEQMRILGVSVSKILTVEERVIGVLILAEKQSGELYSNQDLKLVEILTPEMGVAVQNSEYYDKIKKFNLILTDEIKKATSDLQNANVKLQELDKLKDDFVSIASHELRTPMTAIRSYVWMSLHRSDIPLSDKLKRYLYRTLISTERLINLVNDLLNVSRIEGGKIEVVPVSLDIIALVKDVIEDIKAKADEKQIKLFVLDHPNMPKVFADPDKVREVLLNLLGNSLKFTYPDGAITVDFFTDGRALDISVKDTGSGISKEDLGRLFQKFGRLENSYVSMSTSGGTGLGLYISKSLVELMHGKMWATSDGCDKGSTFFFSLPISSSDILQNAEHFHIKPRVGEAKPLEPVAI